MKPHELILKTWDVCVAIVYLTFAYLEINIEMFTILVVLMIFDTIIGSIRAIKQQQFKMRKLLWGFIAKIALLSVPAIFALIGKSLGRDYVVVLDLFIRVMCASEGVSSLTNVYNIKTGKSLEHVDFISMILLRARQSIINIIQNIQMPKP